MQDFHEKKFIKYCLLFSWTCLKNFVNFLGWIFFTFGYFSIFLSKAKTWNCSGNSWTKFSVYFLFKSLKNSMIFQGIVLLKNSNFTRSQIKTFRGNLGKITFLFYLFFFNFMKFLESYFRNILPKIWPVTLIISFLVDYFTNNLEFYGFNFFWSFLT